MNLTKEQEKQFQKLSINSFSELALYIPHKFEDYRILDQVNIHQFQVIDATVETVQRSLNSIQITFFAHNFGHKIRGVVFKPKPYMIHQFSEGERNYFYGKIECNGGQCTMSMPRKVSNVGMIIPKYKSALRSDVMQRFVENNLTHSSLEQEGIKEAIVKDILKLHFPGEQVLGNKSLPPESKYALKYLELFSYMKQLATKRRYYKSSSNTAGNYDKWMQALPFTLTKEQIDAIEEIKIDFLKDVAAKRMVVGDVGSGKTMVILASAFMNSPNRSILMAPTTILANQLYEEAQKFLPSLKTALVTNKTKKIDLSEFDFIIGTHALLYRELPKATLVMVDEQHRFGTLQRNALEKLVSEGEEKPHYIQFSATPIPRTQAMIETSHIDVSLITSTPFKKNIQSQVIRKADFKPLLEHIKNEIENERQVLIVYPLVEQSEMSAYQSIDEARGYWEKNFENVYVTHGKDKQKEDVLVEFRERGNILIATTVVEVGISLPRLSTVIIVGAERLGLSTLHQLRGRVSRTGLQGHCYLFTHQKESQRLEEFVKTTSGFDIANLDLKYRKSGDLLKGVHQSGVQFKWVDLAEDEEIVQEVKKDLGF